jgi:hypothetical protein
MVSDTLFQLLAYYALAIYHTLTVFHTILLLLLQ